MLKAFAQAILNDTPMIADGREGANSLTISNAVYLSSWTDDWVELSLNEAKFEEHLKALSKERITSKSGGKIEEIEVLLERRKVKW